MEMGKWKMPSRGRSVLICKSLGEDFDGRVLNPLGVEVDLPFRAFKWLKKLHLLERDRESESLVTHTRFCETSKSATKIGI
jgi:hypothetical protein